MTRGVSRLKSEKHRTEILLGENPWISGLEDIPPLSVRREREQSLLIGQTHVGPLLETLSVSLAMSLAFSVSAL